MSHVPDPRDDEIAQLRRELAERDAALEGRTLGGDKDRRVGPGERRVQNVDPPGMVNRRSGVADRRVLAPAQHDDAPAAAVAEPVAPSRLVALTTAPVVVSDPAAGSGQVQAEHAVGPGSAGATVAELAGLLEAAGHKTYLTDPNSTNASHVFTDAMLATVRRALYDHPEVAAVSDPAESAQLKRWIDHLDIVSADVWLLLRELADAKAAAGA